MTINVVARLVGNDFGFAITLKEVVVFDDGLATRFRERAGSNANSLTAVLAKFGARTEKVVINSVLAGFLMQPYDQCCAKGSLASKIAMVDTII